jgi:SAM-dependent methyltransferase
VTGNFASGAYWNDRQDLIYYRYVDFILRCIAADAKSLLDVGTGNCPYPDWFDWIPGRTSIDLHNPYSSSTVRGIVGDIFTHKFAETFDVVTCLQVLEHVPDVHAFARRLLTLGTTLVVSVPNNWPKGRIEDHIHDPVDLGKLEQWFERKPNYVQAVREPFLETFGDRLICIYDRDPNRRFDSRDRDGRILRAVDGSTLRRDPAAVT